MRVTRLWLSDFRNYESAELEPAPGLTVVAGDNGEGKSNLLEAVQMLSRLGTSRTLADAFAGPVRGYPLEAFTFPPGGLPELLRMLGVGDGQALPDFEVLMRLSAIDATPRDMRAIAFRKK